MREKVIKERCGEKEDSEGFITRSEDVDNDSDSDRSRPNRRASVGKKEKRDSGDGHDADGHSDVFEEVKGEKPQIAAAEVDAERVFGQEHDPKNAIENKGVEKEDDEPPEEAFFFGDQGEDEVGALLWKKTVVGLGAGNKAFSEGAARSHGREGLDDMPTGSGGVYFGIEKDKHPLDLIPFENAPHAVGAEVGEEENGRTVGDPIEVVFGEKNSPGEGEKNNKSKTSGNERDVIFFDEKRKNGIPDARAGIEPPGGKNGEDGGKNEKKKEKADVAEGGSSDKKKGEGQDKVDQSGAQVRLNGHQEGRQKADETDRDKEKERPVFLLACLEITRQDNDGDDFSEFGDLETQGAEAEPGTGSVGDDAVFEGQEEDENHEDIEPPGEFFEVFQVEEGEKNDQREGSEIKKDLFQKLSGGNGCFAFRRIDHSAGVDKKDADNHKNRAGENEREIIVMRGREFFTEFDHCFRPGECLRCTKPLFF